MKQKQNSIDTNIGIKKRVMEFTNISNDGLTIDHRP